MSATKEAVHLSAAVRTPHGKFMGALSTMSGWSLARPRFARRRRSGGTLRRWTKSIVWGNGVSAGPHGAGSKTRAEKRGLPETIAGVRVTKVCGSGLKAVCWAQGSRPAMRAWFLAGGREHDQCARICCGACARGIGYGNGKLEDRRLTDGLECCGNKLAHGKLRREHIAGRFAITRAERISVVESHAKDAVGWRPQRREIFEEIIRFSAAEKRRGAEIRSAMRAEVRKTSVEKLADAQERVPETMGS